MRSHRNENGHTLLVVPRDMIGPFRNALQKLAGGIDFFALDPSERDTLDQALRHLWNPGDDAQGRDKTVPIDVLAINLRDTRSAEEIASSMMPADPLDSPTIRKPVLPSVLTRLSTKERLAMTDATAEDARPTVELDRSNLAATLEPTTPGDRERSERSPRHDGYRAPSKGKHPDVAR